MVVPFKNAMLHAAMRLENNLPAEIREFCNSSLRDISIRGNLKVQPGWGDGIFWRIQKAIIEKRILSIKYHPDCDVESISTDLSPYHLLYNDYVWYVIGGSSFHRRASAFKLNRIKGLEVLNRRFIEAGDFDINSYLGKAWSMRREGRLYNIRLRFLPEVAQSVAEVQWHNTQKVSFKDDGSVIVEFIVDGLSEITWWILSYGNRVQVLTPRILRQRVIAIARNVTWSARPK